MKIIFQLPSSIEADVRYDSASKAVSVRPLYNAPTQPIGYISVMGEKGRTRTYRLALTPKIGRIGVYEMTEGTSEFDQKSPGEKISDDDNAE